MKNPFKIIAIVFILQSCSAPLYDLPYSVPANAPPLWKKAWEDGCKTGLSAYGNDYLKSFYEFTQDTPMMKDPTYSKGWTDSFNFCRAYVNRTLAGETFSKEERPTLLSTRNLNLKMGNRRNDRDVMGTGYLSHIQENKPFVNLFVNEVYAPGYGSTEWGSDSVIGDCDWLDRCGKDKPADWHF